MKVQIKLFADQARTAGRREVEVKIDTHATCGELRVALAAACPAVKDSLGACRFAVNHVFASDDTPVRQGDEVALIGPVSGG